MAAAGVEAGTEAVADAVFVPVTGGFVVSGGADGAGGALGGTVTALTVLAVGAIGGDGGNCGEGACAIDGKGSIMAITITLPRT